MTTPRDAALSVSEFLADYEFRGDGGDYTPTEGERLLIEDAIHGYISQAALATPAVLSVGGDSAALIEHMTDRFLGWCLPEDFSPDAGVSFKADFNENTPHPMKHRPTGTNLFNHGQAKAMVQHLTQGAATPAVPPQGEGVADVLASAYEDHQRGAAAPDVGLFEFMALRLAAPPKAASAEGKGEP